jgi:ribosomal protein L7/L12
MGIFDFFKKKTDTEEYYEKREKENKNIKQTHLLNEEIFTAKTPENNDLSLKELLYSNISKIEKIKRVRELTGLGLKEAKDLVKKHEKNNFK